MAISHFAGENEAARDSKLEAGAPGSKPNAASFFRHRSVAAAVKTGGARSSSQTYVIYVAERPGLTGTGLTSLTNWFDPRVLNLEMIWNNFLVACPLQSMKCTELYWCHFRVLRLHIAWATKREKDCAPLIIPNEQSFESKQSKSHEFAHTLWWTNIAMENHHF